MAYTPEDPDALPNGTVVDGRYRLCDRLGRGGFAWVYEAVHIELDRSAAVKLLDTPNNANAESFRKRFMREAKFVGRLSHPNIVTVYDYGVHEPTAQPYIAMEQLIGHDLEDELRRNGPLEPQRAQRLFGGAAEALRVAHEAGVIHKDLKPSNLFIADPGTPNERMVLLDFGIALAVDEESGRITKIGAFTGTPAYVAPEYARTIEVSPAVDIYQLGLILSESLSGIPCVEGRAAMQMILAHCNGDIVIPDSVRNSPFGAVVLKATAFEPTDRFPSGEALSTALMGLDVSSMPRATTMRRPGEPVTAQFVFEEARTNELESPDDSTASSFDADTLLDQLGVDHIDHNAKTLSQEPLPELDFPDRPAVTRRAAPPRGTTRGVPQQDGEWGWGWYIAGAFLVAIVGVALFVTFRPGPPPQPTRPVVTHSAMQPDLGPAEALFTFASTPHGASIVMNGEEIGRTPFVLRGEAVDGSTASVQIKLAGHATRKEEVELSDGGRLDVILRESEARRIIITRGRGGEEPTDKPTVKRRRTVHDRKLPEREGKLPPWMKGLPKGPMGLPVPGK